MRLIANEIYVHFFKSGSVPLLPQTLPRFHLCACRQRTLACPRRGFLELNQLLILPLSCHTEGHVHLGERGGNLLLWELRHTRSEKCFGSREARVISSASVTMYCYLDVFVGTQPV